MNKNMQASKNERICIESWNKFYPAKQRETDSRRSMLTPYRMFKKQLYDAVAKNHLEDSLRITSSMEYTIYIDCPLYRHDILTILVDDRQDEITLEIKTKEKVIGKHNVFDGCQKIIEVVKDGLQKCCATNSQPTA